MDDNLSFEEMFDDLEDSDSSKFTLGACSSSLINTFKERKKEIEANLKNKRLKKEERIAITEELNLLKRTLESYDTP